jgi:sugar lactone lactonase YvrE
MKISKIVKIIGVFVLVFASIISLLYVSGDTTGFTTWQAPHFGGYKGAFEKNTLLDKIQYLGLGKYQSPEHIAYKNGWVYASMADGSIIRVLPDGSSIEEVVNTKGRPLGFDFDSTNALIIADPMYGKHGGLLRVTGSNNQQIELLADSVENTAIKFADAVVVAASGKIYFTDATTLFGGTEHGGIAKASTMDFLASSCSGRLLEYNPQTKKTRIVMRDFSFANGIAFTQDGTHLMLAECGKYRIWKINPNASNISANQTSDEAHIIMDNLPGFPDNMMLGKEGRIWVGLTDVRNETLDNLSDKPKWRSLILKFLFLLGDDKKTGFAHVFAIDENGNVLKSLQNEKSDYPMTCGATETETALYIHSLSENNKIAWIRKADVGLK